MNKTRNISHPISFPIDIKGGHFLSKKIYILGRQLPMCAKTSTCKSSYNQYPTFLCSKIYSITLIFIIYKKCVWHQRKKEFILTQSKRKQDRSFFFKKKSPKGQVLQRWEKTLLCSVTFPFCTSKFTLSSVLVFSTGQSGCSVFSIQFCARVVMTTLLLAFPKYLLFCLLVCVDVCH